MYKSVLAITIGSLALAAWVGVRPPTMSPPAKTEAPAETADEETDKLGGGFVQDGSLAGNGLASARLGREADGHFYAEARVNGSPVRFLVDTGASTVALTKRDAQAIGLQFTEAEFTGTGQGAGGTLAVKPVMLERLAVGPLEAQNVQAVIGDDSLKQSLLGQSWLARVSNVTIQGDQMELR